MVRLDEVGDELGVENRNQFMEGLKCQAKGLGFYPECIGAPSEDLRCVKRI